MNDLPLKDLRLPRGAESRAASVAEAMLTTEQGLSVFSLVSLPLVYQVKGRRKCAVCMVRRAYFSFLIGSRFYPKCWRCMTENDRVALRRAF